MNRLTFRNKDGVVQREFGTTLYDALNRLSAYEDTGLEPEDCVNYKKFEDEAISRGVPFSRIVELMKAEQEGRLMVLPCQFGDVIYRIVIHPERPERTWGRKKKVAFVRCVTFTPLNMVEATKNFGKTVFLTREEAEKALEGMK